ncbi:MAG: DUF6384 family protein [Pseudomonadota bacterium]
MSEAETKERPDESASDPILDDVVVAMDVVDALRHDERLVLRELDAKGRRQQLKERLREIYDGQGILVTDAMLDAGVQALEEDRFSYVPPKPSWAVSLAKLYVTRWGWGRYVAGALIAIAALWTANWLFVERPRERAAEALQVELADTIPAAVSQAASAVQEEARDPAVKAQAAQLATTARNAAEAGDAEAARAARQALEDTLTKVRAAYTVRIVSRPGALSGLWRIPDANPDTYNFYLVVEAIDSAGNVLPQPVTSEETGARKIVETWAVRVPREVLVRVQEDKSDDGIIQDRQVATKVRGELEPNWSIPTPTGAITDW